MDDAASITPVSDDQLRHEVAAATAELGGISDGLKGTNAAEWKGGVPFWFWLSCASSKS